MYYAILKEGKKLHSKSTFVRCHNQISLIYSENSPFRDAHLHATVQLISRLTDCIMQSLSYGLLSDKWLLN